MLMTFSWHVSEMTHRLGSELLLILCIHDIDNTRQRIRGLTLPSVTCVKLHSSLIDRPFPFVKYATHACPSWDHTSLSYSHYYLTSDLNVICLNPKIVPWLNYDALLLCTSETKAQRPNQWRIQDFCEGDAAGVWPPIFFGRDDPNFLRQIVSAHRRSQDFQRVGAPRGGSRISGYGTMEGPQAPNEVR